MLTIFTANDLALMRDADLMARKEAVIGKVKTVLSAVKEALRSEVKDPSAYLAPDGTDFSQGQLAHGDQFHGLPWVYLDFPKYFSREAMFTFRSFFWWGHGFLFAWFLAGPLLDRYKAALLSGYDRLADTSNGVLRLSLARDPWEWRQADGYALDLARTNRHAVEAALATRPFLKLTENLGLEGTSLGEDAVASAARRAFARCGPVVRRDTLPAGRAL